MKVADRCLTIKVQEHLGKPRKTHIGHATCKRQ